ncbi:MAG TPA: protein kinase [Ramlibacter sp.]|nr:protein kinase [Ramlibacter sp.]
MASQATPTPSPPRVDAAALPAGLRINEYQIERTLGGGGFGITYLARDSNLDLPVAVKEYFPNDVATRGPDNSVQVRGGSDDAQASYDWGLERFLDEARALAAFRHPNIVRVLRYFRANGTAYIVMEYESGLPLKRWVPQNAPLTQRSLLSIIYPLLDGLESVHKLGFLHRDIKPDNIYVRADGSPVLLDFGAARRVSGGRDLTNIVSPGFAPFEQYHSQGHQGPWTDIYSLGAVMYWMTTGKKPVESAARIKSDAMLPASSLAEASVYGTALLQAIEWAMQPEEGKRPQTVAQFREAIQGSERTDVAGGSSTRTAVPPAGYGPSSGSAASSGTPSNPSASSAAQRRTLVCTIMFVDLVGYSVRSVDDQVALKRLFNELVAKALRGVPEDQRIAIDTGDGAAICFMGDPEEALHSAMLLRDLLGQRYGTLLSLRIGLHMGPVRVIADINDRVNVVGDGINVAQRIMDFAQGNQLLVSRAYYDVISRITDDTAQLFQYLGQHEDKHARRHEVYAVLPPQSRTQTTQREGPSTGYSQTLPIKTIKPLDPEAVHEIEVELARHIGPLARVLVRKAQPLAASIQALREALAPSVPDAKARESFLAGPPVPSQPGHSHPVSRPLGPSGRTPQPTSKRQGPAQSMPLSQPLSQPSGSGVRSGPTSTRQVDVPPDELAIVEHTLSKFIGPMARMLVRKEIVRCSSFKEFVAAVALNIDHPQQREVFLQALKRGLPRRPF